MSIRSDRSEQCAKVCDFLCADAWQAVASENSFGNRLAKWREQAGLPSDVAEHGLRKTGVAILVDCGCTGSEIDAVPGHEDAGSGRVYVKSADRLRLANSTMEKMQDSRNQIWKIS